MSISHRKSPGVRWPCNGDDIVPAFAEGHESEEPVVALVSAVCNGATEKTAKSELMVKVSCQRSVVLRQKPQKTSGRPPMRENSAITRTLGRD